MALCFIKIVNDKCFIFWVNKGKNSGKFSEGEDSNLKSVQAIKVEQYWYKNLRINTDDNLDIKT